MDCSLPKTDNVIRRPKAIKASAKKSSSKYQQHQEEELISESQGLPLPNAHQQQQQPQHQQQTDDDDESQSQHPRNRWRCMQPRLCNYCWKTFSNSFNLKQHIVNVHIQSQGVTCNLCNKVVKNKWYLRKHLVTAHGAPLKRVKPDGPPGVNGLKKLSSKKALDMSLATAMSMGGVEMLNNKISNGDSSQNRAITSEEEEEEVN